MCQLQRHNWLEGEPITVVDSPNVCLNILTRHMVTTLPCLHVQGPMENPNINMLKALRYYLPSHLAKSLNPI